MNLHETSDGILEMQNRLIDARLGINKSVLDIGKRNGFASKCGLVTCDWVGAAEDEILPMRVVIKIPSALPFRKLNDSLPEGQRMPDGNEAVWEMMEGKLRDVHNIEIATYDFCEEFEGLTMPRKYYGKAFGEGIARAIGNIQACSLKKEPSAPELLKDFFEFANTITLEAYRGMFKGMHALDSSEKTSALIEKIEALLPDYYGSNLACAIHKQMGFRPVLVNGDLRTENVLIDKDTGDLAALIDWQCTHLGVGIEDLHRIAMFALITEERRASFPVLVEEMYKSIVENLDGAEPPYTLETLLLLSDLLFPHCALFFAGGCIALITNQEKDPRIADEEKAKRKEVPLDKVGDSLLSFICRLVSLYTRWLLISLFAMSPHHVLMILAAMLTVGAAIHDDELGELAEADPDNCRDELREYALLQGQEFGVDDNRTQFVCKKRGFLLYVYTADNHISHRYGVLRCYEDSDKKPHLMIYWEDGSFQTLLLRNMSAKRIELFCAAKVLTLCEERTKFMYADGFVRMNDEKTNFTCNSAGSIPYIKKDDSSSPQVAGKFLCVDALVNRPPKIYWYPPLYPERYYIQGRKVELREESSIFCIGPNSPNNQPDSGPAPYQQQPGSNPTLAQQQPCSCLCDSTPPPGHGLIQGV